MSHHAMSQHIMSNHGASIQMTFPPSYCFRPEYSGSDETLDSEDSQLSIVVLGSDGLADDLSKEIQVFNNKIKESQSVIEDNFLSCFCRLSVPMVAKG